MIGKTLGSVSSQRLIPSSWSAGGKTLVYECSDEHAISNIAVLSMEGERAWKPLLQEKHIEAHPQISPDGRWMAYMSNESSATQVYVRSFPEVNEGKWQVSTNGGSEPKWSPDGRELFYRSGDAMMKVDVEVMPAFRAGLPKELFRGTYYSNVGQHWDLSSDGKRFLMIKQAGAAFAGEGPRKINIVVNWFEELKQSVPSK